VAVGLRDGRAHLLDERERGDRLGRRRRRRPAARGQELAALPARRGDERERRQVEVSVHVLDGLERVVEVVEQEGEADACA
jgi:hypothetical protein